ncbi:MAG TPA: hypothetical protein VMD07_05990 [Candidatus Acidoferrales bacterium]|nr:hypothetical protein [Candidatus Acidoferrales bacterium]
MFGPGVVGDGAGIGVIVESGVGVANGVGTPTDDGCPEGAAGIPGATTD